MPLICRYCSQCGAAAIARMIEGRERRVCSQCQTVFYQNPLPVASALVLNEKREVLLVRRKHDPKKGMWCLPIGFAELQETIEQAALRELQEEAGVTGRVLQLLDVSSDPSDFYGDLLVVTFEVERTGGEPRPGDDAEQVGYFPVSQLPPLAFASNQKALQACMTIHQENWAIQDSFSRLQSQTGGEVELLSDALLSLLREQAEEVARLWLQEVQSNPTTLSYRRLDPDELLRKAQVALSQFGRWLGQEKTEPEVREFYQLLGRERRDQGFALSEVLSSLTLLRKHVWTFARGKGVWAKPIDAYRVLELDRRIVAFFDRALYHTALGFAQETKTP